jgi:ABC-type phosphate transport system auxiliary subunit
MNSTQLHMAIGIPSFLVLFSLLTNMLQINRLSDKMDRNYETLSVKLDRSYEKLSDRMDRLAEQQHKDSLALQGYMIPLHDRMAVIEAKQK